MMSLDLQDGPGIKLEPETWTVGTAFQELEEEPK